MTPEQAIREDMLKLYPSGIVRVEHVDMNYYEATAEASHAYLVVDGKAIRQN